MFGKKFIIIILLFVTTTLVGQIRKYSNEFLSIGVGASSMAQGNASVASIGDATSVFWNPAGITRLTTDLQVGVMHNNYFAGVASFNYGGMIRPLSQEGQFIGISFVRLDVDMIPNTLRLVNPDGSINYDNIEDFSIADNALFLTYAKKSNLDGMSFGGNFKIIRRNVSHFAQAWGFGFDLGMQYEKDALQLGVNLRDLTTTFNVWSFGFTEEEKDLLEATGNIVPTGSSLELTAPSLTVGGAYVFLIKKDFLIRPEIDVKIGTDGKRNVLANLGFLSIDPMFGLECSYKDIVYLWGGMNNYQEYTNDIGEEVKVVQPNVGIGVKMKSIKVQYAMTNVGEASQSLYSNVFSLIVDINKKSL